MHNGIFDYLQLTDFLESYAKIAAQSFTDRCELILGTSDSNVTDEDISSAINNLLCLSCNKKNGKCVKGNMQNSLSWSILFSIRLMINEIEILMFYLRPI